MVADARVSAFGVVESFDEVEVGEPCFGSRLEDLVADELALEGGKEALAEGVAVANGNHEDLNTGLFTLDAEGDRDVLGALVAVMDNVFGPTLTF